MSAGTHDILPGKRAEEKLQTRSIRACPLTESIMFDEEDFEEKKEVPAKKGKKQKTVEEEQTPTPVPMQRKPIHQVQHEPVPQVFLQDRSQGSTKLQKKNYGDLQELRRELDAAGFTYIGYYCGCMFYKELGHIGMVGKDLFLNGKIIDMKISLETQA